MKIDMYEAYDYRSLLSTRWCNVPHNQCKHERNWKLLRWPINLEKSMAAKITRPDTTWFLLVRVYWRAVYVAINRKQLTPSKARYGGRLLPLLMSHYQMSSPIWRLAYKSAWMLEVAIFSIWSRQTLFCNIQGKYMSILIGNHTKIKKLLKIIWI
jgi:hypothetical protein